MSGVLAEMMVRWDALTGDPLPPPLPSSPPTRLRPDHYSHFRIMDTARPLHWSVLRSTAARLMVRSSRKHEIPGSLPASNKQSGCFPLPRFVSASLWPGAFACWLQSHPPPTPPLPGSPQASGRGDCRTRCLKDCGSSLNDFTSHDMARLKSRSPPAHLLLQHLLFLCQSCLPMHPRHSIWLLRCCHGVYRNTPSSIGKQCWTQQSLNTLSAATSSSMYKYSLQYIELNGEVLLLASSNHCK